MRRWARRGALALALSASPGLLACTPPGGTPQTRAPASTTRDASPSDPRPLNEASAASGAGPTEVADEPGLTRSIRPGANDKYADPEAFETFSEIFEAERREVRASMDAIVGALGLRPGQRVADIGAGTGLFLPALARAVGDTGRVVAVDISPVFLEGLRARVAGDPHLGAVEVHAAAARDLGLTPRSLDAALMCDVYHHVEFPFAYMPTVAEALVDGGELVLVDFERIEGVTSPAMMEHVRADKQTVLRELDRAGFELVEELDLGMRENYALRLRPRRPALAPSAGAGEGARAGAG